MEQTLSGKQLKTLLLLVVALVGLCVTTYALYRNKYVTEYSVKDPDSGQIVLYNSSRNPTPDQSPVLLTSSTRLLELGMTGGQYVALNKHITDTVIQAYGSKYETVSVNTDSTAYDGIEGVYTFRVRLGEIGSKTYLSVSAAVKSEDTLQVTIKDASGAVIKDSSVKVG